MEEFKQKTLEYLNSLETFTKEELPDYFKQYLSYKTINIFGEIGLTLLFVIALTLSAAYGFNLEEKSTSWSSGEVKMVWRECGKWLFDASLVGLAFAIPCFVSSIIEFIQIKVAPKVFLVNHIANLFKKKD